MDTWESPWPGRPPTSESLGRRIADRRAVRGWTQQQLADRLGISRVAVSHLETGLNVPGERTVALLAGCFRVEPHELVAGTDYPRAKADRLPLVAARWTHVEQRLAVLDRDLWWIERAEGRPPVDAVALLVDWEAELAELAEAAIDAGERRHLADARARVGQFRRQLDDR